MSSVPSPWARFSNGELTFDTHHLAIRRRRMHRLSVRLDTERRDRVARRGKTRPARGGQRSHRRTERRAHHRLVRFFLTGIPDLVKGLAAVLIVQRFITPDPWASSVAGVAAVVGHCWSIYIGFRGGMGVGTSAGLVAYYCWPVVPLMIALWLLLRKTVIRHTARSVVIAMLAAGPLTWLFGAALPVIALAWGCSAVLLLRYLSDWNRVYSSTADH